MSIEKKIRNLLNDFLQDVDNEARLDVDLANHIVDVHLPKFVAVTQPDTKKDTEELRKEFEEKFLELDENKHLWWQDSVPLPFEIWDFFAPYLKDTKAIEEKAVREFAKNLGNHADLYRGKSWDECVKIYLSQKEKE